MDLAAAERMEGRRVLVYATHTGTRDITEQMDDMLTRHGFRVAVMKAEAAMLCYMPARPAPPNVLPIELAAFRRLRSQGRRSFRSTPTSCCRRAARVERSGQPNKLAWRAWPHGVAQTVA